jgi:magnesium-transporting ATPase (P-type)
MARGGPAGLVGVADPVKPSAEEALRLLRRDGLRVVMLTGDSRTTADAVARKLGIDEVIAEVLPDRGRAALPLLRRAAQPDDRRRGHEPELRLGDLERPPPAPALALTPSRRPSARSAASRASAGRACASHV